MLILNFNLLSDCLIRYHLGIPLAYKLQSCNILSSVLEIRRNNTCLHIKPFLKDVCLKRHFHGEKSIRVKRDVQIREVQRESELVCLVFGKNSMDREVTESRILCS